MIPIISVVGKSDVGKTTFLEKLVPELVQRGYRVAVIKHDMHGFDLDQPGKDTWRLAQAGSSAVAISSPRKVGVIRQVSRELSPDEVALLIGPEVDIILTEGYKRGDKPKIEVSRQEVSPELLCQADELLAIVSDQKHPLDVPQFDLDDVAGVADLLVKRYLRWGRFEDVLLVVDGQRIPMKGFVRDIIERAVRGMVSTLEGVGEANEITLVLRRPPDRA